MIPVANPDKRRVSLRTLQAALERGRAARWTVPEDRELTDALGTPAGLELPRDRLRVLVWNVYKGRRRDWALRFREHLGERDLILAQELYFEDRTRELLHGSDLHWTTATSFHYARRGGVGTGLGTAAPTAPTREHALQTDGREPLTGTPKLALLTEYPLGIGDRRLLVANVHAINFAGFDSFDAQLRRIEDALADHRGPTLLAGDFNTWSRRRRRRLDALVAASGLAPVEFSDDPRTTPLDHAFVRELGVSNAEVHQTRASDHAALSFDVHLDPDDR